MIFYLILQQPWEITYISPNLQLRKLKLKDINCALAFDCTASKYRGERTPAVLSMRRPFGCAHILKSQDKITFMLCFWRWDTFIDSFPFLSPAFLWASGSPREAGASGQWWKNHFPSLQCVQALNLWPLPHDRFAAWEVLHSVLTMAIRSFFVCKWM